jgi:hypothetical protein
MSLTVLSVGYALAPVGPDATGGAEQILSALDRGLVAAGHHSLVVAPTGSEIAGRLIATAPLPGRFTAAARRRAEALQRRRLRSLRSIWCIVTVSTLPNTCRRPRFRHW